MTEPRKLDYTPPSTVVPTEYRPHPVEGAPSSPPVSRQDTGVTEYAPIPLDQYPTSHTTSVPTDPTTIARPPSIIKRVAHHHVNTIDKCTFFHLRGGSFRGYNDVFLRSIYDDFRSIYSGSESIDELDWLAHQRLSIRATLGAIDPQTMPPVIETNQRYLRFAMIAILGFFTFGLYGAMEAILSLIVAPLSGVGLVNVAMWMCLDVVCVAYYFSYGYHCYALKVDRFIFKEEYVEELKRGNLEAWLSFT